MTAQPGFEIMTGAFGFRQIYHTDGALKEGLRHLHQTVSAIVQNDKPCWNSGIVKKRFVAIAQAGPDAL